MNDTESLYKKLDLLDFIARFKKHFARPKSLAIVGDIHLFKNFLDELENIDFTIPSAILPLDDELVLLSKQGVLKLSQIFEFVKIVRYFLYLKKLPLDSAKYLSAWLLKIEIPQEIFEIVNIFMPNASITEGVYENLDLANKSIKIQQAELKKQFDKITQKHSLREYLIDRQIHLVDSKECLLLKAGFDKVLNGKIVHRTQAGYFYVFPNAIESIHSKLERLQNEIEVIIYNIECEISAKYRKFLPFLRFINKEFDTFDALQARICFAREHNYNFVVPNLKSDKIILCDFCHPMLKKPIPCNINVDTQMLLITGVNAGGKTMLLKSILSAALLSKLLLPFKINPHKSKIGYFKHIYAIINDPQNAKNDISTFAGRMLEFKNLIGGNNFLLGIDEVELGTDANEASALYFALLEHLQHKHTKIILTTHHKQLASMMADNPHTKLVAALYDEHIRMPKYTFLEGCIGKSYAFESAMRYGIPISIINRAKAVYGENLEHLNELIEQTSLLKTNLAKKEQELDELIAKNKHKNDELNHLIESQYEELRQKKLHLESTYNNALNELKAMLKETDTREIHRFLNKQHNYFKNINDAVIEKPVKFSVGSRVQSGTKSGTIVNLSNGVAFVELDDGMKLKIRASSLKPASELQHTSKKIQIEKSIKSCNVSLDLHGKRVEEALELLDKYISDCLIAGFDEVIIYHGIGEGVLSRVVKEFLSSHPKVKDFCDAPSNQGGFGAKIVRF